MASISRPWSRSGRRPPTIPSASPPLPAEAERLVRTVTRDGLTQLATGELRAVGR